MSYTPKVNANTLTLYLGICGTGRATASSTTLDMVSFGTLYNPRSSITFQASDVGMPIAIVGGGPVDPDMPSINFVQGALFHTTIAAYVSPTQVTLTAAPDTSICNTGFATVILYRPCPFASDQANVPTSFEFDSSIAPGTNDTLQFSVLNSLGGALGTDNPYVDRFGALQLGQPVYLTSSDSSVGDIFGGYIDTLTTSSYPGVSGVYCWSAQCVSWAGLARRRVVPPAQPQTFSDTGDVVFRKIVLTYLQDDGVSVTAATAPEISLACPVGANIGQLLDQVVSLCSTDTTAWYWNTDPWRNFILATRTGTAAPWNVTDGEDLFAGNSPYQQSIVQSHNQMANTSYAIGAETILNTLNVTLVGNGSATTFNLPAPCGATPTITLNGSAQTVGVLGVDTGDQWYWAQDSAVITQDSSGTVLTSADTLLVSYSPLVPAVAQAPNVGSLQSLQAIEGTSAVYSHVTQISSPILPADLLAIATAYELEYGTPAATCQFYTLRPGLAVGQLQSIDLSDAGIASGEYLIATVKMSLSDNVIVWQYTAFGGANIGNAITALTQFINRDQATLTLTTPVVPLQATAANPGQAIAGGAVTPAQTVTFPNAVTKGNLLVVACVRNNTLASPPPISDSLGNTWIQAIYAAGPGPFENQISLMYAIANSSGTCTVMGGTIGAGGAAIVSMMEFIGLSGVDVIGHRSTTPPLPPTITLTQPGDLVVTAVTNVITAPTVTAPEVALAYVTNFGAGGQPGVAMSYEIVAAAGSFTSSLDVGGSDANTVFVSVAFRAQSGTPGVTTDVVGNPQGTVSNSTGALTAGLPVIGNGGSDVKVGVAGQLVPSGGTAGQILTKNSSTNYDTSWEANANTTHSESLTDGNSNFIFAVGDIVTVVGVPN